MNTHANPPADQGIGVIRDLRTGRPQPWAPKQYAAFMRITEGAAAQERYKGNGPPHIKVNGRVYYDPDDVFAWLDAHKKQRTDDSPGAA